MLKGHHRHADGITAHRGAYAGVFGLLIPMSDGDSDLQQFLFKRDRNGRLYYAPRGLEMVV